MQFADLVAKVGYLPPQDLEVLSRAYETVSYTHLTLPTICSV